MKSCKNCVFFLNFFCRSFNIPISSTENASHCKNYKIMSNGVGEKDNTKRRKRCNKCKYLEYSYNSKTKRCSYMCSIKNKFRTYTALVFCDKFEKNN